MNSLPKDANTLWLYLGSLSGNPSLLVSSGVAVVCGGIEVIGQ